MVLMIPEQAEMMRRMRAEAHWIWWQYSHRFWPHRQLWSRGSALLGIYSSHMFPVKRVRVRLPLGASFPPVLETDISCWTNQTVFPFVYTPSYFVSQDLLHFFGFFCLHVYTPITFSGGIASNLTWINSLLTVLSSSSNWRNSSRSRFCSSLILHTNY